jgi:hypothetical protein
VKPLLVVVVALIAAAFGAAPAADAQPVEPPVHRVDVSVGGGWLGGVALGDRDANLRANATTEQPYRLFSTSERLAGTPTLDITVGFALTRRWAVEGSSVFSRPELRSSVTADAEGAPALTVVERVDQYVIEGRVIFMLQELRLGGRTIPFAAAGAGYLRQLHEGQTLIEEGQGYHVGGGLRHWLRARETGFVRAAGVRVDARLYLFAAGIRLDDGPRPHGAVSGAFFVTF